MKHLLIIISFSILSFITINSSIAQSTAGGGTVECFSQSYAVDDFDYYDCGNCEKVTGRRGYGNTRQCTT